MQRLPQQHPSAAQATRLALAKFSYTTVSINHIGPLTWTHVPANSDICCLFEKCPGSSAAPAQLVLSVLQGHGILEQIDLAYFAKLAADHSHQVPNNALAKPHFTIIVKLPCLAIKYPLNGTHIRRFQVKFSSNRDYYTALALLSEINCSFSEPAPPPALAPRRILSSSSCDSVASTVRTVDAAWTPKTTSTIPLFPSAAGPGMVTGSNPRSSLTNKIPQRPPSFNPIPAASHAPSQRQQSTDLRRFSNGPSLQPAQPEPDTPNSRPSTAPAYHDIEQLKQMLPPKRDLPFTKPAPKQTRLETSDQSAHQRASLLPPLCHQLSPGKNQSKGPSTRTDVITRSETRIADSQTRSPSPTQPYPSTIATQPVSPNHAAPVPPRSAPGQPAQMPVVSDRNISNLPQSHIPNTTTNIPQSTEIYQPLARTTPKAPVEDHLALYLSAPTPERVAFLENWMCDLIEDDKFMVLCQDVDVTWRRFAFGNRG